MSNYVITFAALISVALSEPAHAQSALKAKFFYSNPSELQFSCAVSLDANEEAIASRLEKGNPDEQIGAARELWDGHSRRHARHVMEFISDSAIQTDSMTALKQIVENSLKPDAILHELHQGDQLWGFWLSFLRPHEALVPELLAELMKEPPNRPEVILALGRSGDRKALEALLQLVDSSDYRIPGDAANALGYMAFPEAEQKLIGALSRDNGWLKVQACSALRKVGSRRALPALERIAKDKAYAGSLSVRSAATSAIEIIEKRNPEAAPSDGDKPAN